MELTKYVKPYRVTCDKFQLDNVDPGDTLDLDIGKPKPSSCCPKASRCCPFFMRSSTRRTSGAFS